MATDYQLLLRHSCLLVAVLKEGLRKGLRKDFSLIPPASNLLLLKFLQQLWILIVLQ